MCEDTSIFESSRLSSYDAIILNYGFWDVPQLSDRAKEGLLEYVRNGGGLVPMHFACSSYQDWDEYAELLGRVWVKGVAGHGPRGKFTVKIVDKQHPITAGMADFETDDELYAKLDGKAEIHVLATADSDWSKKTEPLVFVKKYGKGNVVHNLLGHDVSARDYPEYIALLGARNRVGRQGPSHRLTVPIRSLALPRSGGAASLRALAGLPPRCPARENRPAAQCRGLPGKPDMPMIRARRAPRTHVDANGFPSVSSHEDSEMNVKEVILSGFGRSKMVTEMLLGDLSDLDIMQRPVPGANHAAWQLGHLVTSLNYFGEAIQAGSMPALPAGFSEKHTKETATSDEASAFSTKDEYVQLLDQQRTALQTLLGALPEARLDEAAPEEMRGYAPTIADVLELAAAHEMMHSGQFTVLRRKLGKPVTF